MTLVAPDRVVATLIGDRGRVRRVTFREGGRAFRARVNEDNLWGAVKDNMVLGEYEREGIRLADARGVVIDAGAHVGLFSLLASAHARAVVALEAHAANFAVLADNVAQNGAENVEVRHCALWSEGGSVDLVEGPHSGSGSLLGSEGRTMAVRAETLDSIVTSTGPVDLLKLDIEGAEFAVLDRTSDATLRQISAVVAELHVDGRAQQVAATLDRLRGAGFTVALRRPPLAYWRETMRALIRNRRRLQGERRLRLTVLAVYSLAAAIRLLPRVGSHGKGRDEFMFLYATRGDAGASARS